jgi:hypothetical protein
MQLQALLHEVEERAAAVPPEAMADLLAGQAAGGAAFALARAWLDAVRVAQARGQALPAPPFAPRLLCLPGRGSASTGRRPANGALHTRARRIGVAR